MVPYGNEHLDVLYVLAAKSQAWATRGANAGVKIKGMWSCVATKMQTLKPNCSLETKKIGWNKKINDWRSKTRQRASRLWNQIAFTTTPPTDITPTTTTTTPTDCSKCVEAKKSTTITVQAVPVLSSTATTKKAPTVTPCTNAKSRHAETLEHLRSIHESLDDLNETIREGLYIINQTLMRQRNVNDIPTMSSTRDSGSDMSLGQSERSFICPTLSINKCTE